MRRRSRRAPNISESTGKIGQELPSNQPAPLVPFYPDEPGGRTTAAPPPQHRPAQRPPIRRRRGRQRRLRPPRPERPAKQEWNEAAGSGRFELETQPEMPSAPPPEPEAAERSPQAPKGYVVLAIGMPGSGKTTWFRRRGVTPLSSDLLRNICSTMSRSSVTRGWSFRRCVRCCGPAHCAHALELRGRNQSLHSRAPPMDQDGQELWLRGSGGVLRCSA